MANHPQETLPGSRVRYDDETNDALVLSILPNRRRALIWGVGTGAAILACAGFAVFLIVLLRSPGAPFAPGTAFSWGIVFSVLVCLAVFGFAFLFLGAIFRSAVGDELSTTCVHVTREQMVITTTMWGREQVKTFPLSTSSCVKQYWGSRQQQLHDPWNRPSGFVVTSDNEDKLAPDFGANLSCGELDWVEWRINRFLGHATDADAPAGVLAQPEAATAEIEKLSKELLPAPEGMKVRIEERDSWTCIHFPNTVTTGKCKGIDLVVVGLLVFGGFTYFIVIRDLMSPYRSFGVMEILTVVFMSPFWGWGLVAVFAGLTRLFGGTRLTISPERIMCRTTLLGILPFYWKTLRTPEVISVVPSDLVIRTARKGICFADYFCDGVRNAAEADWLREEIELRIQAARSGRRVPPLRDRRQTRPVTPRGGVRPPPEGPVPYDLQQRPLPSGKRLPDLLPAEVGLFRRTMFDDPRCEVNQSYEVEYRSDAGRVSMTLSLCDNAKSAQRAVAVAQGEAGPREEQRSDTFSLDTEPSFFRTAAPDGAGIAWSRGNYFFLAEVRGENSKAVLDRFMGAFPY